MTRPLAVGGALVVAAVAQGQTASGPPVRKLGPATHVSSVGFTSIQHIRQLADGRVLVNDASRRQVLLLDSTLSNPIVVVDSAGGRQNSYGLRAGGLLPFRSDSSLFIDPVSTTMLVIDPRGQIARVMAVPATARTSPTSIVNYMVSSSSYGFPGYSERFGLVFRVPRSTSMATMTQLMPLEGAPEVTIKREDSAYVMGLDVSTRRLDTLGAFGTGSMQMIRLSYLSTMTTTAPVLYPVSDDWTVMADGSVAILSGREYRIHWLNVDGTRTDSPRIPFPWKHLDDAMKQTIADSINAAREQSYQEQLVEREKFIKENANKRFFDGTTSAAEYYGMPTRAARVEITDIPDYFPAVERTTGGVLRGDADNNLWIRPRPAKPVPGGSIYDIVNRAGELIDRVQLPAGRTLLGFGRGHVVYVVARDAGAVKLEALKY